MKQRDFDNMPYELLMRFFADQCSADEVREIQSWKSASEQNASDFAQAKMAWVESKPNHFEVQDIAVFDSKSAWPKVRSKVLKPTTKFVQFPMLFKVAALFALVCVVTFFIVKQVNPQKQLVEIKSEAEPKLVELADGSDVELNAGSQLLYEEGLTGSQRVVQLQGEAFFEIHRDTTKPFVVKTNNIDIRVLGTSFNVDATTPDSVEVQVETGVVQLMYQQESIQLSAGETGVFYKDLAKFVKRESKVVVSQFWRNRKLTFKRTELSQIIQTLNRLYEVDIQLESAKKQHSKLNVRFEDQDIDLILDILSNTLDLKIEKEGDGRYKLYDAE